MSTVTEKPWYQFPFEFLLPTLGNFSASSLATYLLTKASPLAGRALVGAASFAAGGLGGGLGQLGVEAICQDSINWKRTLGTTLQILVSGGEAYFGQDRVFVSDPIWKKALTYTGKAGASCYDKSGVGLFLISSAFNVFQSEINRSYVEGDGIWQRVFGEKKWSWNYSLEVLTDLALGGVAFKVNRHWTPKISDHTLEKSHIRSFLDDDAAERFFRNMTESEKPSLEAVKAGMRAGEYFLPRDPELSRDFFSEAKANLEDYYLGYDLPIPEHPYSPAWKLGQERIKAYLGSAKEKRDLIFFERIYKVADQWGDNPARYQALKGLAQFDGDDPSYSKKALALAPWFAFQDRFLLLTHARESRFHQAIKRMEERGTNVGILEMAKIYDDLPNRYTSPSFPTPRPTIRIAGLLQAKNLSAFERKTLEHDLNLLEQIQKREYQEALTNIINDAPCGSYLLTYGQESELIHLYHQYEILNQGRKKLIGIHDKKVIEKQIQVAINMERHWEEKFQTDVSDEVCGKLSLWRVRIYRLNEIMNES